jgi:phosphomevalonate kinase
MKKLKEPTDGNYTTTSFHNVTIYTTPNKLIELCGLYDIEYHECNTGEDKCNFDFEFYIPEKDVYFTVYDWKEYETLREDRCYTFHIGAKDKYSSLIGKEYLVNELKKV